MNIFLLHVNGRLMALLHSDAHVVKMILEMTQLCCNVYYYYTQVAEPSKLYRKTHVRHPMSIFVAQNRLNFMLVISRALHLAAEYTRRFGKTHKCDAMLKDFRACPPDFASCPPPAYKEDTVLADYGPFRVPLCMPSEFHDANACVAYGQYYLHKLSTVERLRRYRRGTTLGLPLAIRTAIRIARRSA